MITLNATVSKKVQSLVVEQNKAEGNLYGYFQEKLLKVSGKANRLEEYAALYAAIDEGKTQGLYDRFAVRNAKSTVGVLKYAIQNGFKLNQSKTALETARKNKRAKQAGETAKGETAKGETAKGETAKGETAKGETAKSYANEKLEAPMFFENGIVLNKGLCLELESTFKALQPLTAKIERALARGHKVKAQDLERFKALNERLRSSMQILGFAK